IPGRDRRYRAGPAWATDSATDCRELDRSFRGLDLAGERKARPVRLDEANGNSSRRQRTRFGFRHPIEANERDAAAARCRAHRPDLTPAGGNRRATFRRGAVIAERPRAGARDAAMLDARPHFLADIAAFGEIDPAELIHIGFMRKGVAIGEIEPAARHAERDAVRLIIFRAHKRGAKSARRRGGAVWRYHHATSERR